MENAFLFSVVALSRIEKISRVNITDDGREPASYLKTQSWGTRSN